MILALTAIDYIVLAFFLLVMLLVGLYFNRQQHSTTDFFLAGRSMSWMPVGLSVMATLLSALSYTGIPGEAYQHGFKLLVLPLAIWLTLPLMLGVVLPLYHGLKISTIYEYLEMRFDSTTRTIGSVFFIFWRLAWLGGVLYAPCKVLTVAADIELISPELTVPVLIIILGLLTTAYTFLGGMKAVIWTDVIQSCVMLGGLLLVIGTAWYSLEGGAGTVIETARTMGRSDLIDLKFDLTDPARKWSFWGVLPHMMLAALGFYVADQITAQRFLTTRSLRDARRSFVLNCVSITVMLPLLVYTGVVLLAYYQDKSKWQETIPPKWVVNVSIDPETGEAIVAKKGDEPLIDWDKKIDGRTIAALVAEQKVIDPNRKTPFKKKDIGKLVNDKNEIIIRKIGAQKNPSKELIFNPQAKDEFLPRYLEQKLPLGLAGLILAALLAASMSSVDSGLNSISTLLIFDFHRRLGWGRAWLAGRRGKTVDQLDETDELTLARPMVLIIGVVATACSLLVAQIGDIFGIMVRVVNTFGGPLLGVFLLGMLFRRITARAAIAALLVGTLLALWLTFGKTWGLWPWEEKLSDFWPLTFSIAGTLAVGHLVSFLPAPRKSDEQLEGLVLGLGRLGQIEPPEATMLIDTSFADEPDERK